MANNLRKYKIDQHWTFHNSFFKTLVFLYFHLQPSLLLKGALAVANPLLLPLSMAAQAHSRFRYQAPYLCILSSTLVSTCF
jgi:hypothetical protein